MSTGAREGKGRSGGSLPAAGVLLLLASCAKPEPCRNTVRSDALSPDQRLRAIVFLRECPSAHTIRSQISIVPQNEPLPDADGNIFSAEEAHSLRVAWTGQRHLEVYSFDDLSKARRLDRSGDVTIEFQQAVMTDLGPPAREQAPPASTP